MLHHTKHSKRQGSMKIWTDLISNLYFSCWKAEEAAGGRIPSVTHHLVSTSDNHKNTVIKPTSWHGVPAHTEAHACIMMHKNKQKERVGSSIHTHTLLQSPWAQLQSSCTVMLCLLIVCSRHSCWSCCYLKFTFAYFPSKQLSKRLLHPGSRRVCMTESPVFWIFIQSFVV